MSFQMFMLDLEKVEDRPSPRGMVRGGRREEGSGWGTHVCLWWIHFDIWQNKYNIVKFKNKIKKKNRKGRGMRNQVANTRWIIKKARVSEKHLLLLY